MSPTRRTVLGAASVGALAVAATATVTAGQLGANAAPPGAAATAAGPTGPRSPNGWVLDSGANVGGAVWTRPLTGTGLSVDVSIGDAEVVLCHVARRFHYEIDELGPGDVVGFRPASGLRSRELNHASGTAIDLQPRTYPNGARGGFFAPQLQSLRDILAECEGVVRWGGDFATPHEAHFQIDVPPNDPTLVALAARLRGFELEPADGAGVLPDLGAPSRQARATALARRQRAAEPTR